MDANVSVFAVRGNRFQVGRVGIFVRVACARFYCRLSVQRIGYFRYIRTFGVGSMNFRFVFFKRFSFFRCEASRGRRAATVHAVTFHFFVSLAPGDKVARVWLLRYQIVLSPDASRVYDVKWISVFRFCVLRSSLNCRFPCFCVKREDCAFFSNEVGTSFDAFPVEVLRRGLGALGINGVVDEDGGRFLYFLIRSRVFTGICLITIGRVNGVYLRVDRRIYIKRITRNNVDLRVTISVDRLRVGNTNNSNFLILTMRARRVFSVLFDNFQGMGFNGFIRIDRDFVAIFFRCSARGVVVIMSFVAHRICSNSLFQRFNGIRHQTMAVIQRVRVDRIERRKGFYRYIYKGLHSKRIGHHHVIDRVVGRRVTILIRYMTSLGGGNFRFNVLRNAHTM